MNLKSRRLHGGMFFPGPRGRWGWLAVAAAAAAPGLARASFMSTVQASNPSSYYRLEETSGTTAADSGSLGLTANYNGGFTLGQPGIPGGDPTDRAVTFNGTTGYAAVSGTYTAVTNYPVTLEAFVKSTNAAGTNQNVAGLTNNGASATGENLGLYIQTGRAAIRFRSAAGGDHSVQGASPVTITDGNFHQIVGVFDSATQRELYVDGKLVAQDTTNFAFPSINTLGIGALARSTLADFLNGTDDEVAVYNTPLSASTIASQYAASGVPEPASAGLLMLGCAALLTRRRRPLPPAADT